MKTDFDKKETILELLEIFEYETEHIEDDCSFEHEYGFREDIQYYYNKYIYIDQKMLDKYLIKLKKEYEFSDDEIKEIKKEILQLEDYEIKDLDEDEFSTYITTIIIKENKEVA